MDWAPPLDWDSPNDGETTEEMLQELDRQHIEEEIEARRNQTLWNDYSGHFGRDGKIVIPRRRIVQD